MEFQLYIKKKNYWWNVGFFFFLNIIWNYSNSLYEDNHLKADLRNTSEIKIVRKTVNYYNLKIMTNLEITSSLWWILIDMEKKSILLSCIIFILKVCHSKKDPSQQLLCSVSVFQYETFSIGPYRVCSSDVCRRCCNLCPSKGNCETQCNND